jgi:hypothetical protein
MPSGRLCDIQPTKTAKFGDMETQLIEIKAVQVDMKRDMGTKFGEVDTRFIEVNARIDALPPVLAELLAER